MDGSYFRSDAAGQCRKTIGGYWAFFPHPLPPELEVDWELTGLLSQADRALSELSGTGSLLPNPHILISPYLRREAILSSRIENTHAEMEELFRFEAEAEEKRPDVREVANYVGALEQGLEQCRELPICSRIVTDLHERLLRDVRGGSSHLTPGEYRRSQNWIGPAGCTLKEATFVPPPPEEIGAALSAWENYLNEDQREPDLVQCALMHYQFEAIHPFLDGNGRVGRLLVTLFLCQRNLLSQPLLYLSAFFEKHRDEYYRRLLAVSREGDWRGWVEYFLRGVREQAREALVDAKRLLDLYDSLRGRLQGRKHLPHLCLPILDALFENPLLSVAGACERRGWNYQSATKAVSVMEELEILREVTGQRRNKLYLAEEILAGMRGQPSEDEA
jgi:Fic family protein